ncbi:hypothetical protein [Streptomyces sp. NPDC046821]|uniref:hypothetical protein n=1 Tax=Streptomyces sp. NPDC046821 TaxID=3154702 RepID=UPI00340290AB
MAKAYDIQLPYGSGRVLPAKDYISKPVILVADGGPGATDLGGLEKSLSSFLTQAEAQGLDVCLVGFDNGERSLRDLADAVQGAVNRINSERIGSERLVVGGVGRGAVVARYALTKLEYDSYDHETKVYYAFNAAEPSAQEAKSLDQVGGWPQRPMKLQLTSDSTGSAPEPGSAEDNYDDYFFTASSSSSKTGTLLPEDATQWLLDRVSY